MKKYYYSLFAAVSLLLAVTSCSQEEDFPKSSNGVTSFSISLDGAVGSRTAGDGKTADKLFYEVYLGNESVHKGYTDPEKDKLDKPFNLDLPLLNGETYSIIFWAQNKDCSIYDLENLNEISIDYSALQTAGTLLANQESYDAFYNALVDFEADGNTHKVELRRPFAQLNLGTSDWDEVVDALPSTDNVPVTATSVTVTGLADKFFPLTGVATGNDQTPVEATFGYANLINETFSVNDVAYQYLSLNYLLVPGTKTPNGTGVYVAETDDADKALVDLTFNLKRGETELQPIKVTNAPMRRNWRTNIIGDVLTGTSFDIVIEHNPDNDNNDIRNIDGIDALKAAMLAHGNSESSVTYYVNGLSTLTEVTVPIPANFKANNVTFIFNNIQDDAKLTIQNDTNADYKGKVNVKIPQDVTLNQTTINLPNATVELLTGTFGSVSSTTASHTLIIGKDATVSELTVEQGNVEIYGTVGTVDVADEVTETIIVALGEGVEMPIFNEGDNIVFKPEDGIVQVGHYCYETLQEALEAIETEEGTIKILEDCAIEAPFVVPAGKTITLDLNGSTLSYTSDVIDGQMIKNDGTLTLNGAGSIVYTYTGNNDAAYGKGNYTITNHGTLIVDDANVSIAAQGCEGKFAHALYAIQNAGKMTLNKGKIYNPNNVAIRLWVDNTDESKSSDITINGGEVEGLRAIWIQLPNSDKTKAPYGNLTVTGGTLTAWAKINDDSTGDDSGNKLAVYSYSYGNDMKNMKININGGTFNGDVALTGGSNKTNIETLNITGGTFNGVWGDAYSYGDDALAADAITITGGEFSSIYPMTYMNNENEVVKLGKDVEINEMFTFKGKGTLNLNGNDITGTDTTEKNFSLIDNRGTLTITGEGKISVKATVNSGWNRYSAALANNPGGNLTVDKGVVVEHLGGTDMAYGIDNLTNGKGTSAIVTIDGATVKSPYRAIRQFLNGVEATNELYVKSGVIEGANKSVWMQDPSKNANTGKLVVSADAQLKGDVYLSVTEGSTEWPVNVSIAADALAEDAEVLSGNVPAGYGVILEGGIYKVVKNGVNNYVLINGADELIAVAEAGIKNNEKVFLIGDIDLEGKTFGGLKATNFGGHNSFDGQGYTVSNWTYDGGASDMGFIQQWVGPVSNINFYNCHLKTAGRSAIAAGKIYGNIDNIHIDSSSIDDSYWACGAVAGLYNAGSITNCTVTNTTVKSNGGTGGIVGVINEEGGERALINCSVSNSTINNTGIYGASYSGGGLIGLFNAGEATYKIENCKVESNKLEGEHIFETYPTIAAASLDEPIK